MFARLARLVACALLVCLAGQPLLFIALGEPAAPASACCKDKQACCCRRSHGEASGAALVADPACAAQCHIPVRSIKPLAAIAPRAGIKAAAAPAIETPAAPADEFVRTRREVILYPRPPPSKA